MRQALLTVFIALTFFLAAYCLAEDGSLGPTSTAQVHIELVVPPRVNIGVNPNGTYNVDTNLKQGDFNLVTISETKNSDGSITKIVIMIPKL